jgi:hypothetical protein
MRKGWKIEPFDELLTSRIGRWRGVLPLFGAKKDKLLKDLE